MKQYREKHADTSQRRTWHRTDKHRPEGNAVDNRMDTKSREQSQSAHCLLGQVGMVVGVGVMVPIGGRQVTVRRRARKIMLVKMKPTEKQQHKDETRQRPDHDRANCPGCNKGVRYQVEQGHAQHEPGYQAQYHLGAIMGHAQ